MTKNPYHTARLLVLIALLWGMAIGVGLLFFTRTGQQVLDNPHLVGPHLSAWVKVHPVHALAMLFGLYLVLTIIMLPVWWLQILAGYTLGILWGVIACQLAATLAAVTVFCFSRWLAADWFHTKVESRMHKLRAISQRMGHNGFLIVMATRLVHVMPFALSNYAFGLITITTLNVAIGTLLGNIPGVTLYVTAGADPRRLESPAFWLAFVALNVILILPVAWRYKYHSQA